MIRVEKLEEYCTLMNLKKYCENKMFNECNGCMMYSVCDLLPVIPSEFEVEYVPEKGDEFERLRVVNLREVIENG